MLFFDSQNYLITEHSINGTICYISILNNCFIGIIQFNAQVHLFIRESDILIDSQLSNSQSNRQ